MDSSENRKFIVIIPYATRAEFLYNKLIKLGVNVEIMATPCVLYRGCSRVIKCDEEELDIVKEQAKKYDIGIRRIYERVVEGKQYKYTKME